MDFSLLENYTDGDVQEVPDVPECGHEVVIHDKNIVFCSNCGMQVNKIYGQHKDWSQNSLRGGMDPRNIYNDVENMYFPDNIKCLANDYYTQATGGKIYRGKTRKAIIAACIYHAYKNGGDPQVFHTILIPFSIDKKTGLKGLKFFVNNIPNKELIQGVEITPKTFIKSFMNLLGTTDDNILEVINIYEKNAQTSIKLLRSRPQSVAAGVIYYWILHEKKDCSLSKLARLVRLSEMTIAKISKELK
jgi:transcription initiation factor TFIIIB Brf1 subunit/transcription initiation factor TFIIB